MKTVSSEKLTTPDLVLLSLLAERSMHGYQANALLEFRKVRDWVGVSRPQVYYSLDKLARLPTVYGSQTVTAGNAPGLSTGASAVVLMSQETAEQRGLRPLARIVGYTSFAREPEWFTLAPVGAIRKLLTRLNLRASDVDLYEVNEAFAVVAMAAIRDLDLDHARVNVNGGACALGHPIGATGVRIVTTLIHALKSRGQRRGVASLCIGGGEATAIAVEVV